MGQQCVPTAEPEAIHAAAVTVIASKGERGFPAVRSFYESAPEPKSLRVLDGSAHAQNVLATDEAGKLTKWILESLAR